MAISDGLVYATKYNSIQSNVGTVLSNYGVTPSSSQVSLPGVAKVKISEAQWDNLRLDIVKAYRHQQGFSPTITDVSTSNLISWADVSNYESLASSVYTNRNLIYTGATGGAYTAQYATQGSSKALLVPSGWNVSATMTFTATWGSAAAAAQFFNLGGRLYISCSANAGTPTLGWTDVINGLNNSVVYDVNNYVGGTNAYKRVDDSATNYTANYGTVTISKTNEYTIAGSLVLYDDKAGTPDEAVGFSTNADLITGYSIGEIPATLPTYASASSYS